MKAVIFTDLDGTLLDENTYSFEQAMPALQVISEGNIPLVLCSSKTRAEIEVYRKQLNNIHPFISENGGGVFVPTGYFPFHPAGERRGEYLIDTLGTPYKKIRKEFVRLRERLNIPVKGFGDMTATEVAALTRLSENEAAMAKQREFDEPFVFEMAPDPRFLSAIEEQGLRWTQGRFFHMLGNSDKGVAVRILIKYFEKAYGKLFSIGLGDSMNDLALLREVDCPVLIRKENERDGPGIDIPNLVRTNGTGPAGWNEAILTILCDERPMC